jgi:NADH-quinone oxidoreductase subunit N
MNLAAFAVVVARERESGLGDDIAGLVGLGASRPLLAGAMTVALLGLAGIPATAGFIGKFFLIEATVDGGYTWLGVVIVIGSMISLAYYLRILAAMWMQDPVGADGREAAPAFAAGRPALAGGAAVADAGAVTAYEGDPAPDAPEAARRAGWEVQALAAVMGVGVIALGVVPSPLLDLARDAARGFTGFL